jgi:predicted transcriptional regulator
MNIEAKKLELIRLIMNTNKESLLSKIALIFEKEGDWWEEISIEEKKAIEQGLHEADNGEFIPHETILSEVRKKYNLKSDED